jgi:hypothetical protein
MRDIHGAHSNSAAFNPVPAVDASTDLGTSAKRWRDGNFVNVVATTMVVGGRDIQTQLDELNAAVLALQPDVPPAPVYIRFPKVLPTQTNQDNVFASTHLNADDPLYSAYFEKYYAYEGLYGLEAVEQLPDASYYSWVSPETSTLQVDDAFVIGAYNYVDIGSTSIIKRFQIYCADNWFPISYHINELGRSVFHCTSRKRSHLSTR